MDEKELRKEFDKQWKEKNQTKYVVWLIFYIGSIVPLLFGVLPLLMDGPNDSNIVGAICGIAVAFVMEIVAMIINRGKVAEWKEYLANHKK